MKQKIKRHIRIVLGLAVLIAVFGTHLNNNVDVVHASNGRVINQRAISYSNNRPIIDGDFYWKSSRAREWLHSTSTNPQFTNKGIVTRRTRGFLSGFTTAERNQIAITRRKTPVRHNWNGGLTSAERIGDVDFSGNDGLGSMVPFSMRYQGSGNIGDPMSTDTASGGGYARWRSTITHDKVFIPTAWELQRYVESRGWSLARGNTSARNGIAQGYWVAGTQTYTGNISRGVYVTSEGRVAQAAMRNNTSRGIVPMLHLKPNAAAGRNKKIGDIITFGRYDSNNAEGHRGVIRWRIVNETPDGHKLIMAEQAVDHFNYNVAPSGDRNNTVYTKSNHVNFNTYDVDIVGNLLFQNTNESGTKTTRGNPLQPWFRVVNTSEFHRRNTSGARFQIQGRAPSGSSPDTVWVGGNFVRGSTTIEYRATANDPVGYNTPITIKSNLNTHMIGHLPYNMIDAPVNLDVKYDLPYNGYAANNQYVDIDVGLSNWDVNHVIPHWKRRLTGDGGIRVFSPPDHTTYAGTRYRMSGRMRVTDWGDAHSALSAAQWNTQGLRHLTYSNVRSQPRYLHDMYLTAASYNNTGMNSRPAHGYDGSVGPVDHVFFMPWARLRDAPGAGWVNFSTVMPIPNTWIYSSNGMGFHAVPNMSTLQAQYPEIEIENWTFELLDDQMFKLDWIRLPNGNTVNNPPVGSMTRHRATSTGNYSFTARDSRGYNWNTTANIKIDKTAPTGAITQNTSNPTNGNVTLTLDSQDVQTGLSKVEYISGGEIQSSNISSINQNNYVPTHRSTFVVSENGTYRFRVTDRAGNFREVTRTVGNIDRTPPTTSVSQSPTATVWTNKNVTVSWKANAEGLSDLRRVRFHDGSGWSAWTNTSGRTQTFNRTITGNTTVHFEVEDMAGNLTSRSYTVSNIDKDLPEMTFSHNPSTWTNTNVTTTIRARDHGANDRISGLNRMRFRSHSGLWSNWIIYPSNTELSYGWFNQTSTITKNGGYDVQVEDRAGNQRIQAFTVDWIDRTGPEATVRLEPNSWTNQNVKMIISGKDVNNEGSRISGVNRIRMRRAGASTWLETVTISDSTESSPSFAERTFTVTDNGTYEFELRDRAGNTSIVRQTVDKIDRTPPKASGSFTPDGWTNQDITITWIGERTGNPGAPLRRYRTYNGSSWSAWKNASNPDRISVSQVVSSNGTYRFEVQDEAGNIAKSYVVVSKYDNVAPVGNIRARFNRTESEVVDGSSVDVEMIDQNSVTVDVFGVEDLGISGVEFIEIEEQRRTGSITSATGSTINNWQTVDTYRYDWPDPYTVRDQTYQINASQALDTRFILTVQDRAGNRSTQAISNDVRHSVLQFKDLKVVDVVNPQLTHAERDELRNVDLATTPAPVTAGTNVTFELTYHLRHLDAVERLAGNIVITMKDDSGSEIHTINIPVDEPETGHNQNRVTRQTFTVPDGVPRGTTIHVTGNLLAELEHGTRHEIWYPNDDSMGSVDNHLEEFFRFRIVK